MTSSRWQRAWNLFDQALDLPPEQRQELLTSGDADEETQRSVGRWLRADADSADFLEDGWLAREVLAAPDLLGRRLGTCRITARLGQGGMGTVYLAHQADQIFDRKVAVKVLSWRPFGESARRRFQIEQQALGRVDHPAVARIFAGGTTEEGFPYLILEYVPGQPLDQYCEQRSLSVTERVALLRRICQGVSACHQRLIVHSDLKPSNILVRDDGQPKLLDFGIASLLDPSVQLDDDCKASRARPLTPHYASPEQLRGEPVSTASDVFSLGVILHQLLCGTLPSSGAEQQQLLSERAADRPAWARALRGDLDSIVRKALQLEPARRYPSVESLSQDLGHYLDGLAVDARSGGPAYRALKLLRRNRWPAATALAAFITLLILSGGLWFNNLRIEQERAGLLQVARFFFGVFEQAGPWIAEGVDVSLKEALDRSSSHLAIGPAGEPRIHAALVAVLGEIYLELGEPERSLRWSRQALDLHLALRGERSREAAASLDMVGAAQRELGNLDAAEQANRAALAVLRQDSTAGARLLIQSLNHQVNLECWRESYQAALGPSSEALALAQAELLPAEAEAIEALLQHAQVVSHVGDPGDAAMLYHEAQETLQRQFPGGHPKLAMLHNNLARIYADQGRHEDMVTELELADQLYEQHLGPDHYQRVKPLLGLAINAKQQGQVERAVELYRQAAEIGRKTSSPGFVLRPTSSLARFLLSKGRCAEAEEELRLSLARLTQRADKPWRYFDAQSLLGETLICQGRLSEAAEPLRQSLAGLVPLRQQVPKAHQRAAERWQRLQALAI